MTGVNSFRILVGWALCCSAILCLAGPANAKVPAEGYEWVGGEVKIYDSTPAKMRWSINFAIKQINRTGARVKLVKVKDRKKAAAVIVKSGNSCSGYAPIGSSDGYRLEDFFDEVSMGQCDGKYRLAAIAGHELLHLLGLGHTKTDRCSLMGPILLDGCLFRRNFTSWRCGLFTNPELRTLKRLYGRRKNRITKQWCRT